MAKPSLPLPGTVLRLKQKGYNTTLLGEHRHRFALDTYYTVYRSRLLCNNVTIQVQFYEAETFVNDEPAWYHLSCFEQPTPAIAPP